VLERNSRLLPLKLVENKPLPKQLRSDAGFKKFAFFIKGRVTVIKGFRAIAALSLGSGATVNKTEPEKYSKKKPTGFAYHNFFRQEEFDEVVADSSWLVDHLHYYP